MDEHKLSTEDQRLSLAAIILLSIYTGCRPAEVVDASKCKAVSQNQWDRLEDSDDEWQGLTGQLDDPDYNAPDPWDDPNNSDYKALDTSENASYGDDEEYINKIKRSYKAICYEDIRLWIVQNPMKGERDLLAMEVTLAHHKGVDNKPKP